MMAVSKEPEGVVGFSQNIAINPQENTLTLNKIKGDKVIKRNTNSPDYHQTKTTETHLEKCVQLEKENMEVKSKLKKMESYCRDCKTELHRSVKRFREFKDISKDLDTKNKQLLIKNQQMRQRVTDILKENKPHRIQKKTPQDLEKGIYQERKILTQLQQENKTLRETLEHSNQILKDAELKAERSQKEKDELEKCLHAVQTEKKILRQEVKRLHKEYMSLTKSILLQLQENKKSTSLVRNMHYSSPHNIKTL